MKNTAILLSGGLDSAALAAIVRPNLALFVDYGQVCADAERQASQAVAQILRIKYKAIKADCSQVGFGDLSGNSILKNVSPSPEWWPYRNQLIVSIAAPIALSMGVEEILFGAVKTDSVHADGTEDFYTALDFLMRLQEGSISVSAPAINKSPVELVQEAKVTMEVLGWTFSCHTSNLSCGECRGCFKREAVLKEAGLW